MQGVGNPECESGDSLATVRLEDSRCVGGGNGTAEPHTYTMYHRYHSHMRDTVVGMTSDGQAGKLVEGSGGSSNQQF